MRYVLVVLLSLVWVYQAQSTEPNRDNGVYIIFDGSGSMWGQLDNGEYKIQAARKVLSEFFDQDFGDRPLALRVYGHRREGDCDDTELVQDFTSSENAKAPMQEFVTNVNPKGKTPISRSLRRALDDFDSRNGEIILISDGEETCDDDPCELVRSWADKDIAIKVHVVGLGLNKKEKMAMQCIADASGTEYQDAQTGEELARSLGNIRQQSIGSEFFLSGLDNAGNPVPVRGSLSKGTEVIEVASNGRFVIPGGEYELLVGVPTRNGSLYRPIRQAVKVHESGTTNIEVIVEVPPKVSVRFIDQGEVKSPSGLVYVSQGGKKLFRFRAIDEVYVDEGEYVFQVAPDAFNELSQPVVLKHGDQKVVEYQLLRVVRVVAHFVAMGGGERYRGNSPQFWQDGEKKFTINGSSGGNIRPGTYDIVWPDRLTFYRVNDVIITDDERQDFQFIIPGGYVTFRYLSLDGTLAEDKRAFVAKANDSGSSTYAESGERIPLPVGDYVVTGWRPPAGAQYQPVSFSIAENSTIVVDIPADPQ